MSHNLQASDEVAALLTISHKANIFRAETPLVPFVPRPLLLVAGLPG